MDAEKEEDTGRVRDFRNRDDKQKEVGKWTMRGEQGERKDSVNEGKRKMI